MKRILTGLFFFTLTVTGFCQEKYQNKKITGAAPNTAALGKFTEYPVDLYTGLPQIGVPLYEIKLKGVSVPVTLSYHASGIRVDDISGNVGMGWALSAGGTISIHPNGILDEMSGFDAQHPKYQKVKNNTLQSGYTGSIVSCFQIETTEDKTELYSGADIAYLRDIARGTEDSEADIYSFSFAGRSGKFFLDENRVFRTIPYSMLKIEQAMDGNNVKGYTITDENGTVYEFLLRETSYTSITNNCNPTSMPQVGLMPWGRSYNLTKITTVFGETIRFYYTTQSSSYMPKANSSRARFFDQATCGSLNANGLGYYYQCGTASTVATYQNYIDSIISSDFTGIYFIYSNAARKDLPGSKIIAGVTAKNRLTGEIIKSYTLTQDYYESAGTQSPNPDDFRLRLKQVSSPDKPPYIFDYESGTLPSRLSFSQDYYGYYNGRNNPSLFIKDEWNRFNDGGDRVVDPEYSKTGVLNKITWPTGGFTNYSYENNEYRVTENTIKYDKHTEPAFASQPNQTVTGASFTFPANGHRASVVVTNTYDGSQTHNDYCIVHLYGPNGFHKEYRGTPPAPIEELLTTGTYYFQIENVGNTYTAEAAIFWFEENVIPPHNEPGGGLRIKEIQAFTEPGKIAYQHKFEYTKPGTTESSGKPMYQPLYLETKQEDNQFGLPSGCACPLLANCNMHIQHTNSILPLGFSNGNSVSYTDVTDYFVDKTKGGYTHSKFVVSNNNSVNGVSQFPNTPQINYDWFNGSLLEKDEYKYENGVYIPISKTQNIYNYTEFQPSINTTHLYTAYSAKTALWKPPTYCNICPPQDCNAVISGISISNIAYGIAPYKLYSSWHRLDKTMQTNYENNIAQTSVNELYYDNPNHLFPTRKITYDSKGRKVINRNTYPADYSGITGTDEISAGISHLKTAGVLNAGIENTTALADANGANERVMSAEINIYDPAIPLQKKIQAIRNAAPMADFAPASVQAGNMTADSRYETLFEFKMTPINGNILEKYKVKDVRTSYIWDYQGNLPVAEAVNTTSDDIAYCSFESDGKGNWSFSGNPEPSASAVTGAKVYSLPAGDISRILNSAKTYIISFWKQGTISINNATIYRTGQTINNWTYVEYQITNAETVTITGSGLIDELRLYPKNAQMTSYTYKPLVGMTSQSDTNGNILYYEYDNYGRLKLVRDMNGKVIKVVEYKYNAAAGD